MIRPAILLVESDSQTRTLMRERIASIAPPEFEVVGAGSAEEKIGRAHV